MAGKLQYYSQMAAELDAMLNMDERSFSPEISEIMRKENPPSSQI